MKARVRQWAWAGTALIAMTMSGCGAFDTKDSGKKAKQTDTKLAGTWRTACFDADWLGLVHSRETYVFSATGTFDKYTERFSDKDCTQQSLVLRTSGTFDTLQKAEGDKHPPINFTVSEAVFKPMNDDVTTMLNNIGYCGIKEWRTGEEKSILAHECQGEDFPNGMVVYDVYEVKDKQLTLGDAMIFLDKTTAKGRPKDVDAQRVYTKE